MVEKSSLLRLLDSGDLSKVLGSLKEQRINDEKVKTISYEYDLLEEKYRSKSISTRKYKADLKKLIEALREWIEALPTQNVVVFGWKKALKIIGWIVGIITFLGAVAEASGYSLRDILFKENESKTDTLNKVDINTSGDRSPAINAPNGEVKIEYQELESSKKTINKSDKTKN